MAIHGVDGDEYVKLSNMKTLSLEVKKADKIINF